MKNYILVILHICLVSNLIFCQKKKVNIQEFKQWDINKQAAYINKLDQKEKMEFLSRFLPNSDFGYPPNEDIRFLKDGRILVYSITEDNKGLWALAYWKYENNSIIIWKEKNSHLFPHNALKRKIIDCHAEKAYPSSPALTIFLKGKESDNRRIFLSFEKYGLSIFDEPNEKKRMEKLLKESK